MKRKLVLCEHATYPNLWDAPNCSDVKREFEAINAYVKEEGNL